MASAVLKVEGMSCNHCVNSVEGALSKVSGVESAKVNLSEGSVTVAYQESTVNLDQIKRIIKDQGYDVK